jgi:Ca-activated chloride channel family protein
MHIANRLTPKDQLSLIVYDDDADVLVPLTGMNSSKQIQEAIDQVTDGGCTNLFGGWLAGAEQLEGGNEQEISRVLLLSDGQANRGETAIERIEEACKTWSTKGISTTTVGLGRSFNEDLMIAMARAGGGQQYYGQTAEDLFDNFDEELSLLESMFLRQISVKLIPAPGVIVEVLSISEQNADSCYKINDLAWGSETWLGLRLHVSPSAPALTRDLLAVAISGTKLDGTMLTQTASFLQLPVVESSSFNAAPSDDLVLRRVLEVEFGKAALVLRQLSRNGSRDAVLKKLKEMDHKFGEHAWLKAKLSQLHRLAEEDSEMMLKEASFTAFRMSRRLVSKSEMKFGIDETDSDIPSFLRKKVSEGRGKKLR